MTAQQDGKTDLQSETVDFLAEVLPTKGIYFVVTPWQAGGFKHHPCTTPIDAAEKALELDEQGLNTYFACASYLQASYIGDDGKERFRTSHNAAWVKSFWCELDCGEGKAEAEKGYATIKQAGAALKAFCLATGIPAPTVVLSGGGLHCYWIFSSDVTKEAWLPVAFKFKELARDGRAKLLADPSRTADIASLLRPVGTHNWKPERNGAEVKLHRAMEPMEFSVFSSRIDSAHAAMLAERGLNTQSGLSARNSPSLSLDQTVDALRHIDPDVDRKTWWSILAAIADAYGETARPILRQWSAGDLHGKSAASYQEADFEYQFTDALKRDHYSGNRATMSTVIKIARDNGWISPTANASLDPDWVTEVNERFAWIEREASVYRLEHGDFIEPVKLKVHLDNQAVAIDTPAGSRVVGKGSAWLKSRFRRQHNRLVLRPGEAQVTEDNCLNEWQGFAVQPSAGDVQPFVALLSRLVPDDQARSYLLSWLAHLMQRPGTKMHVAPVLWSVEEGVGKNLLFECVSSIIGPTHAVVIGQSELSSDFNAWATRKIFVIGDEVSSSDRRQDRDKLKGLITSREIHINEKHQPVRTAPNLLNFVFLSNNNDALFLGDADRRYFVLGITAARLPEPDVERFVRWRDNGGLSALLHHLLALDLSAFNPKAPAPSSEAKLQMIQDNRSD